MASVSGSKVTYSTSDGSRAKQHAQLNYTKTDSATTVKVVFTSGVLVRDSGVTVTPSYWKWQINVEDNHGNTAMDDGQPASASYGTSNVTCFSNNRTFTYTKGHSATTRTTTFYTQYTKVSGQPKSTAKLNVTVPALASYSVTYNNNGGSGTHAAQTKWYGESLTLTTGTHPTRTGYTFAGWYTAATGGTSYGSTNRSYTSNAALTLYAHWTENTYTISYNANGGSGAPESHTRLYTATGTVSSVIPTRHLYRFAGWNTSSDGTGTSYLPGATIPANTLGVVLYAQWVLNYTKPVITSVSAVRVNSAGVESDGDDATYANISVSWAIDTLPDEGDINAVDSLTATLVNPDSTTQAVPLSGSTAGDSGVGTARVSGLSVDNAYSVIFTLADTEGNATLATLTISRQQFQVDYSPEGGIGFGTPAAARKLFSVAMDMAVSSWAGVIQMFAGSTPPAGWLLCDGSAVSREDYATLYAAIGDTWGAGDGSTTFNLPDLRGRTAVGVDPNGSTDSYAESSNMLLTDTVKITQEQYLAYKLKLNGRSLTASTRYTLQLFDVHILHAGKTETDIGLGVYWGSSGSQLASVYASPDNDGETSLKSYTSNEATYAYCKHLTITLDTTGKTQGDNELWIYNSLSDVSATRLVEIGRWMLNAEADGVLPWEPRRYFHRYGAYDLGTSGGIDHPDIQTIHLPSHTHSTPNHKHTFSGNLDASSDLSGSNPSTRGNVMRQAGSTVNTWTITNSTGGGTSGATGDNKSFDVRSAYAVVNYIIHTGKTS